MDLPQNPTATMPPRTHISGSNSGAISSNTGYQASKNLALTEDSTSDYELYLPNDADVRDIDNYYVGCCIKITGDLEHEAEVTAYNGTTRKISYNPPSASFATATNTNVTIYNISGIAVEINTLTIKIDPNEFPLDTAGFVGQYITMTNGNAKYETRRITDYNSTTNILYIDTPWQISRLPESGDSFVFSGESLEPTTFNTTQITVGSDRLQTITGGSLINYADGYLIEVIRATNTESINQVRTITEWDGNTLTISPALDILPTNPTFRIFRGKAGEYQNSIEYSSISTEVIVNESNAFGFIEYWGRPSANSADTTNQCQRWGTTPKGNLVGSNISRWNVSEGQVRIVVISTGLSVNGYISTRFGIDPVSTTINSSQPLPKDCPTITTRSILMGESSSGNQILNMRTSSAGELKVELPITAFDELATANITPQFQTTFSEQPTPQDVIQFKSGTLSTIRQELSKIHLRLADKPFGTNSISPGDFAVIRSKKIGRYRPGLGAVARFTVTFNEPVEGVWQFAGLATSGNALEFGYFGAGIGGTGQSKFGINRGAKGRLEIRAIEVTGTASDGDITITLPGLGAAPSKDFTVPISSNNTTQHNTRGCTQNCKHRIWSVGRVICKPRMAATKYK